mmetsp:Transcript_57671/g.134340  ORF Transcript_57671/g.134340 Transcript_57671/m.134340 type:complete len:221 (+) Transcript_57671:401-1063(+)
MAGASCQATKPAQALHLVPPSRRPRQTLRPSTRPPRSLANPWLASPAPVASLPQCAALSPRAPLPLHPHGSTARSSPRLPVACAPWPLLPFVCAPPPLFLPSPLSASSASPPAPFASPLHAREPLQPPLAPVARGVAAATLPPRVAFAPRPPSCVVRKPPGPSAVQPPQVLCAAAPLVNAPALCASAPRVAASHALAQQVAPQVSSCSPFATTPEFWIWT